MSDFPNTEEQPRKILYLEGYIEDRIRRGDLPDYMRPDFIPPGMGGLPPVRVKSMELESSFVVALRNAGIR